MDAKDVAKAVVKGCPHSIPVIVPCESCVESSVKRFESSLRDSVRAGVREEWSAMQEEVRRLSDSTKDLNAKYIQARGTIARLEADKVRSGDQIKALKKELADVKLCLDTEQVAKQYGFSGART